MFSALSLVLAVAQQAPTATAYPPTVIDSQLRDATIGTASSVPFERTDDSVPLPTPAVVEPGPLGDRTVAPASGDPYFLGFAAGKYFPAPGERIDPGLALTAAQLPSDGRPAGETYAYVMFQKRMTEARVEQLRLAGARMLGFHPFYTLEVALSPDAIDAVASLDFVRWVGAPKSWQKIHPDLSAQLAKVGPQDKLALYIDTFDSDLCPASVYEVVARAVESDPDGRTKAGDEASASKIVHSNGWQQRELERLGVTVGPWVESIHAFQASVAASAIEELVGLDFVQFVELDVPSDLDHDEGIPLSNGDRIRNVYNGGTNSACQAGIIDSGLDTGHSAIDPYGVGWDYTGLGSAFDDTDGHGTHTGGTILGNGDVDDSFQGCAPGLGSTAARRFFVVRKGGNAPLATWLAVMHNSYFDGTYTSQPPMLVSNSYSGNVVTTAYIGSEANPRTIDAEAFANDQLWIWSASNEGPTSGTIGLESCAKNALTVGNVLDYAASGVGDPGTIWTGSSRGPCGDGRWKPNLCAAGQVLSSCEAGTLSGYVNKGGTSMSTPLVSGLAAQLCDHYSFLRYNPACLAAVLMAGAMTHNNQVLSQPTDAHLDSYGTGRVDAYKANYGDSQQSLYFWSFNPSWTSSYTELPFTVSAGATRLTFVMRYEEAACSAGASQAQVNDLDTWLDVEPFSAGGNAGDFFAQQSNVDNTEVRIVDTPTVGDWKAKVYPTLIIPFQSVRVGVCVIVTYGDTTPTPTYSVTSNDYYVQPGDDVTITASYTNPSYIASAVFLDSTASGDVLTASYNTMLDGSTADLMDNQHAGNDVCIGDVIHGTSRTHHWTTHWNSEGAKSFAVDARSDNAIDATDSVTIYVDGTEPGAVTNLHSTSHTINVWSDDDTIDMDWNAATDNLSGIDGYGVNWGGSASIPPANTKDVEQTQTNYTTPAFGDSASWYFSVRSVDNSGNWDTNYVAVGPYKIDTTAPGVPTNVTSPTHTLGVQSCNTNLTVNWTAATDNLSGLAGYAWVVSTSSLSIPIGAPTIAAGATSFATDIGSSASARYFHLRAVDNAGNYGTTVHFGPIYANSNSVVLYCTAKTNSLGCLPAVGTNGVQPSKSAGNFAVTCNNVISQKNGLCFWGRSAIAVPFQGGTLCIGAPTVRTANVSSGGSAGGNDCSGSYSFTFNTAYMTANSIDPGETIFAQFWMRDPAVASTTGLSNAVQFTVCQ